LAKLGGAMGSCPLIDRFRDNSNMSQVFEKPSSWVELVPKQRHEDSLPPP